ncbi:hypothetical protein [Azonexus fungiphilus]|uniref:hypothetical protein n=1 Tax=Azonexus fungiphilus TaxID=146940 RepID=UPI00156B5E4A|nr:hypothetical protein [Azonexus fungiphilus]NHC05896.1 hypothetical protein [Azonexus fungiphilus]
MTTLNKPAAPAARPLQRVVSRLLPKTFARLQRIETLRAKCALVERKWHLLRMTNFGTTGTELSMVHFGLAMEFERERYWFMKSIPPLPKPANKE